MTRWLVLFGCFGLFAGCAGGDEPTRPSADGGRACTTDGECDDGVSCTVDSCGAGNVCRNMPLDALCAGGETCDPVLDCTTATRCTADAECDDSVDCTVDSCGVDNTCRHMTVDALCDAGQACDAAMGCVAGTGCAADADCDDSVDCTVDSCAVDMTCRHMAVDALCDGGETCSETMGCYTPMPCDTADDCDDGDFCNGDEVCMPEFGCAPAPAPRMCDDSSDCTMDTCDDTAGMCVFACDSSRAECMCASLETPCDGTFTISPVPMQTCAGGMVDYHVMQVTFSCVGDLLSVQAGVPRASLDSPMTQMPRPMDGSFDVVTRVEGACWEEYRLTGRFVDADSFTATFSATYAADFLCAAGGCANQTISVTGTRM